MIRPIRPDKLARIAALFARWGASPATGAAITAMLYPDETRRRRARRAQLRRAAPALNALAHAFAERGLGPGKGIGIMARNHRGFVEATLAASKLGASVLYLNTVFSGPQLADVMKREGPEILVYDEEFADLLHGVDRPIDRIVGLVRGRARGSLDRRADRGRRRVRPQPPDEEARFVILTSGTTGTPKGAQRSSPAALGGLARCSARSPIAAARR